MEKGKIFFEDKSRGLKIICDDFLKTSLINPSSVDLIVTSPPYNVDIRYGTYQGDISYSEYLEFTAEWLKKALELVKTMDGCV